MKTHIIASLIEANKKISTMIDTLQTTDLKNEIIVENVNEVIRQLDKIVESMEKI